MYLGGQMTTNDIVALPPDLAVFVLHALQRPQLYLLYFEKNPDNIIYLEMTAIYLRIVPAPADTLWTEFPTCDFLCHWFRSRSRLVAGLDDISALRNFMLKNLFL